MSATVHDPALQPSRHILPALGCTPTASDTVARGDAGHDGGRAGTSAVASVVGSILTTVPASPSAAQTAPSAYVRSSMRAASWMLAHDGAVCR